MRSDDRAHTPFSDPGEPLPGDLPRAPAALAAVVRGLLVHREEGPRLGFTLPAERREDAESRYVREMLRILRERGGSPFGGPREPSGCFAGTCRDFALLLVSLLRSTGTPARLRCGFATYFAEGRYEDHWVAEYRLSDGTARLADAQVAHPAYELPFDPLDVPRERFLVAGDAWRLCRSGTADPGLFGVSSLPGLAGLWFVAGDVMRDLAARHGGEVLPWDVWGLMADHAATAVDGGGAGLAEAELALLDEASAAGEGAAARRLYADPRLTLPAQVLSYTTYGGVRKVTLPSGPRP